jgi:hypothetical protein
LLAFYFLVSGCKGTGAQSLTWGYYLTTRIVIGSIRSSNFVCTLEQFCWLSTVAITETPQDGAVVPGP